MASKRIVYAMNCKSQGRVHRVTHGTAKLPRDRQLVHCGWRITKSVSLVYYSFSLKWGTFCKRCFPDGGSSGDEQRESGDAIEQFVEDDMP
jgi:hypothetical protein